MGIDSIFARNVLMEIEFLVDGESRFSKSELPILTEVWHA